MIFEVKAKVLEYRNSPFQKDGKTIEYRYALVDLGGQVVKFTSRRDLSASVGKDVVLKVELFTDGKLNAKLRIAEGQ